MKKKHTEYVFNGTGRHRPDDYFASAGKEFSEVCSTCNEVLGSHYDYARPGNYHCLPKENLQGLSPGNLSDSLRNKIKFINTVEKIKQWRKLNNEKNNRNDSNIYNRTSSIVLVSNVDCG